MKNLTIIILITMYFICQKIPSILLNTFIFIFQIYYQQYHLPQNLKKSYKKKINRLTNLSNFIF